MTTGHEALLTALERENAIVRRAEPSAGRNPFADAIFNGAVEPRPIALVTCVDERAVRAAVRVAADHVAPVAVLAGGHDMTGRAFDAGNLVLDLRPMSQVRVDADTMTVSAATLTRDLLAALPADRVTVTGTILTVGVTGLTLAGGYGRLNSRFGLASDCMTSARVVLADGSVVVASPRDDADLFWALRGGGSGFGVVTSMTLATHSLPRILTAMIFFPLAAAKDVLLCAQDMLDGHPVDLSLFMGFATAPTGGEPMLFVAPLWSGDPAAGEALMETLAAMKGAHVLQRGWCAYKDTFSEETEKARPKGRHYYLPTRTIGRLDEPAADILVEGARRMTSPNSAIVIHDFHGAAAQVPSEATAFPLRDNHYVVEAIASWDFDPADDGRRHRQWAESLSADLATVALPGGYVNLLPTQQAERVRLFYGPAAERLRAVKQRVDPRDLFRSGIGRLEP